MAEKQPLIVIKKINVQAAGAHGGSWKVAFADFMTAMMAFFLLMWLLGQSDEVKKNVSDHFSTPSIIEYNFANYGVQLTLEKLFLDLINEPLKFFQSFITPVDYTPNFMQMGSKNIVLHHLADQLGDVTSLSEVHADEIIFEIPERHLFASGSAEPSSQYVGILEKINGITAGLEDSNVYIDSTIYHQTVPGGQSQAAQNIGERRLDMITQSIKVRLENKSVDIYGRVNSLRGQRGEDGRPLEGSIRVRIQQKELTSDGKKPRQFQRMFGKSENSSNVYDNFVKQLSSESKTE